jgi:hypothetical protein
MTLSKVSLIPPVIKLNVQKIHKHEIIIIEEKINEDKIVRKETNRLRILRNVDRKYQTIFLLIIVIYKKIKMKLNQSLQKSQSWIQMFKNRPIIIMIKNSPKKSQSNNQT